MCGIEICEGASNEFARLHKTCVVAIEKWSIVTDDIIVPHKLDLNGIGFENVLMYAARILLGIMGIISRRIGWRIGARVET